MRFTFDLDESQLNDRMILMQLREVVKQHLDSLSEVGKEELSYSIDILYQRIKALEDTWKSLRREIIMNCIESQFFEVPQIEDDEE